MRPNYRAGRKVDAGAVGPSRVAMSEAPTPETSLERALKEAKSKTEASNSDAGATPDKSASKAKKGGKNG